MIAKTVIPAKMKLQADNRQDLLDMIEAAEGFALDGKIYKISGVFYANLIEQDYALPIYSGDAEEEPADGGDEPVDGGDEPVDGGDDPVDGGDDPVDGGDDPVDGGDDPVDGGDDPAVLEP